MAFDSPVLMTAISFFLIPSSFHFEVVPVLYLSLPYHFVHIYKLEFFSRNSSSWIKIRSGNEFQHDGKLVPEKKKNYVPYFGGH